MASELIADQQRGLQLATVIGLAWLLSLLVSLWLPLESTHPLLTIALVILRGFLHTGLFIVAHDAMHGSLSVGNPRLNQRIGRWTLLAYAGLSFAVCKANHHRHHQSPATEHDPDFCQSGRTFIGWWYFRFLTNYVGIRQLMSLSLGWTLLFAIASQTTSHPVETIILFCVVPLLLSSWQLFLFGTYLPHRNTNSSIGEKPRSLGLAPFLSFASCYHFGYHREHHDNPSAPWFQLPELRAAHRRRIITSLNCSQA